MLARLSRRWRNPDLFHAFSVLAVFSLLSTLITIITVHYYLPTNHPAVQNLSDARLQFLMSNRNDEELQHPLDELVLPEGMLNFYHLPKRKAGLLYNEVTSANRDTSYPLAPDFSFHIRYAKDHVVIYEDYGPACFHRVYLLPDLPTEAQAAHALTSADLSTMQLLLDLDGEVTEVSLQQLQEGNAPPFLRPLSSPHSRPASGMGAYTPFCYQNYAKISYYPGKEFPSDLFRQMVNCSHNDFLCPTKVYSSVSRHSYLHGTKVPSPPVTAASVRQAAALLDQPVAYGPARATPCRLSCLSVPAGETVTLHQHTGPGVVMAMRVRLMNKVFNHAKPCPDWSQLLLTVHFDSTPSPQIDRVPLGALFAGQGSVDNDFMGATLGRRHSMCSYTDDGNEQYPQRAMTGYVYFPMPYWEKVSVTAHSTAGKHASTILCYQIVTVKNYYDRKSTGYFHAHKTYYSDDTAGWRNVLQLGNTWGHIVGLLMEVDDVRARRNVPVNERWAVLQADMVMYLDHSLSASVLGTGLEDYFSYAHGFALAENTSYSFVGIPYAAPRRKEPLSWHCYRLHVLDPIPFHNSVHFVTEGTDATKFSQPARPLPYKEYEQRRSESLASLSHTVLYYAQSAPGLSLEDTFIIGEPASEHTHKLEINTDIGIVDTSKLDSKKMPEIKRVSSNFIGAVTRNVTYEKTFRNFTNVYYLKFSMTAKPDVGKRTRAFLLRREYYIPPKRSWNQQGTLWVNRVHYGTWFVPFGSLVEQYAFKHEDIMIQLTNDFPVDNKGNTVVNIEIQPESQWYDMAYYLYKVL